MKGSPNDPRDYVSILLLKSLNASVEPVVSWFFSWAVSPNSRKTIGPITSTSTVLWLR